MSVNEIKLTKTGLLPTLTGLLLSLVAAGHRLEDGLGEGADVLVRRDLFNIGVFK